MRLGRWGALLLALCAAFGDSALAQSHGMMTHHGVPSRVVADQRVGPYVASLWIEPEVGDGAVYVMLGAADGLPFTPPTAVRVAVAPASGRAAEMVQEARLDPVGARTGAGYVTHLMFDREDRWNVRVTVEGPAGGGRIVAQVESVANATHGLVGVLLGSTPFLLVAFVYWRSWLARRRMTPPLGSALAPSPRH